MDCTGDSQPLYVVLPSQPGSGQAQQVYQIIMGPQQLGTSHQLHQPPPQELHQQLQATTSMADTYMFLQQPGNHQSALQQQQQQQQILLLNSGVPQQPTYALSADNQIILLSPPAHQPQQQGQPQMIQGNAGMTLQGAQGFPMHQHGFPPPFFQQQPQLQQQMARPPQFQPQPYHHHQQQMPQQYFSRPHQQQQFTPHSSAVVHQGHMHHHYNLHHLQYQGYQNTHHRGHQAKSSPPMMPYYSNTPTHHHQQLLHHQHIIITNPSSGLHSRVAGQGPGQSLRGGIMNPNAGAASTKGLSETDPATADEQPLPGVIYSIRPFLWPPATPSPIHAHPTPSGLAMHDALPPMAKPRPRPCRLPVSQQ